MGKHLIPFAGRNYSGFQNQNLLWVDRNAYVMDNHRAAFWCWMQHLDLSKHHSLLHIDRHYDALASNLPTWIQNLPPLNGITVSQYLSHQYNLGGTSLPLFSWDNYLSIYLELFGSSIDRFVCLTHKDGDRPNFNQLEEPELWLVPENLDFWLAKKNAPWIVNIDLDYFFYESGEDYKPMFAIEYIEETCDRIKHAIDAGLVSAITVCLTPTDFTPGWQETIDLADRICRRLNINFPSI